MLQKPEKALEHCANAILVSFLTVFCSLFSLAKNCSQQYSDFFCFIVVVAVVFVVVQYIVFGFSACMARTTPPLTHLINRKRSVGEICRLCYDLNSAHFLFCAHQLWWLPLTFLHLFVFLTNLALGDETILWQ